MTSKFPFDLIIFDCDGTLVDSEAICNQVLVDLVNANAPIEYTLHHALDVWAGNTLSTVLKGIEKDLGITFPDDMAKQYVEGCNKMYPTDLKAIDGALDFVHACNTRVKICVGSNGERQNVFDSLRLGGFSPNYFNEDTTFTRIQVAVGKPAPDLFLFAAAQMGVDPARCLVIEDSPTGTLAGVAAGMEVLGLTAVSHAPEIQKEKLIQGGASHVFEDIIHMREHLGL